jgi:hypothetical protein
LIHLFLPEYAKEKSIPVDRFNAMVKRVDDGPTDRYKFSQLEEKLSEYRDVLHLPVKGKFLFC